MWETLRWRGAVILYAKNKVTGEIVSAIILFYYKNYIYYPYGASNENSSGSALLLHYNAIRNALNLNKSSLLYGHNFEVYDLWGSLSDNPDPTDPMYGVHRMKTGLGGKIYTTAGSYVLVRNRIVFYSIAFMYNLRRKVLHTLRHMF